MADVLYWIGYFRSLQQQPPYVDKDDSEPVVRKPARDSGIDFGTSMPVKTLKDVEPGGQDISDTPPDSPTWSAASTTSVETPPTDTEMETMQAENPTLANVDAVVVGASWAGIWALYLLRSHGYEAILIESRADIGGVWFYTRYPGCRVDTNLPFYEFQKEELWREWNWTERFPSAPDIHAYLTWVTDKLDLRKHMRFNTRIIGATWDQESGTWNILAGRESFKSKFFVPCTGYSTIPYIPIKGYNNFKMSFHSSNCRNGFDFSNKRVAVVGTGASGLQIIEAIAPQVSHLTVFQRTPNLATPARQETYTKEEMQEVKKNYPEWFEKRLQPYERDTFDDSEEERERFYRGLMDKGGLSFWLENYRDMLTSEEANNEAYRFWRKTVQAKIKDPRKAEILAPAKPPHPFGTKRPSLESSYFDVFNMDHVDLVDVRTNPIVEVTEKGIWTKYGHREYDVIVYATGFDFITASMLAMNVQGVKGRKLTDKWRISKGESGIWTHLGMTTTGFPNMIFPMGPQAPTALGLTPQMAEIQGEWLVNVMNFMRDRNLKSIDPKEDVEREWKKKVDAGAEQTLFGKADSWYMGVNIPGRKKEARCWFGGVRNYQKELWQVEDNSYSDFNFA